MEPPIEEARRPGVPNRDGIRRRRIPFGCIRRKRRRDRRARLLVCETLDSIAPRLRQRTNAQIVSPAAATMYWEPSSVYEMGPLLIGAFRRACQSAAPVAASSATRSFDAPPVNTRFPAVLRRPARAPPSQAWLHRMRPVR